MAALETTEHWQARLAAYVAELTHFSRIDRSSMERQRDYWRQVAAYNRVNADDAQAELREIGELFGRECRIDGMGHDTGTVLVAKIPELVRALQARLAQLEKGTKG